MLTNTPMGRVAECKVDAGTWGPIQGAGQMSGRVLEAGIEV